MEQIGELLVNKVLRTNPTPHKKAFYVRETAEFLQKPFFQVLGLTKRFKTQQVIDLLLEAKSWNVNPQALWWKIYKERLKALPKQPKQIRLFR